MKKIFKQFKYFLYGANTDSYRYPLSAISFYYCNEVRGKSKNLRTTNQKNAHTLSVRRFVKSSYFAAIIKRMPLGRVGRGALSVYCDMLNSKKLFLLTVIFLLLPFGKVLLPSLWEGQGMGLFAQQVTFFRTYGHGIYDSGEGVLQASDTGYVVGGITTQSGSNGTDMLIYKTDSMGVLQWYKNIGLNNSIEGARSITGGISGSGYLLAGYQNKYDTAGYNFYVVKTDLNGDTLWTRAYGGSDWDMAYSADTLHDSTYVIAGETYSFGNGNLDMYIIRINQNGDTLWTRTFGGTEDDYAKYVYVDWNNNIMVIGTTNSFGAGGSDVYIIYLNAAGDTIWTKTYGTSVDEYGYSGDMFGDYAFAYAYTQFDPTSLVQETRMFLGDSVACNLMYDVSWFFGEPSILDHPRIRRDGGSFCFTGNFRGSVLGYTNIYLHRTLNGGLFFGSQSIVPVPESEYPHDIRKCFDNGLVVTGSTTSYGPGPTSSFILKTDTMLASPVVPVVAIEDIEHIKFSIYPNPVTDFEVYIDAGFPIEFIKLCDLNGRTLQTFTGQGNALQMLEINPLPTGMYILEITTSKGVGRKKILFGN